MRPTCISLALALVAVALPGCPGDRPLADAGWEEDAAVEDGQDASPDLDLADRDPGTTLALRVPEGAALCPAFRECAGCWPEELAGRAKLALRAGTHLLERAEGTLELDEGLVAGLLVGPEGQPAAPLPFPEERRASRTAGAGWEQWSYQFTRAFELGGETFTATAEVRLVRLEAEQPTWPAEIDADATFRQSACLGALERTGGARTLVSCDPPPGLVIAAEAASGDRARLEVSACPACDCAGNTSCVFLGRAEVTLGGETREVDDPLRLAYSAEHHNFAERYAVGLSPPLAGAAVLLLEEPDLWAGTPGQLVLLDAALEELSRQPCTAWAESAP